MKNFLPRLLLVNLIGATLLSIYLLINHRSGIDYTVVVMPETVPFWPAMALPYLVMLVLPVILQMLIQDRAHFLQSLLSVFIGFTAIATIWILHPTEMPRPPIAGNSHTAVYKFMIGIDRPVNIFPCGHVLWPVVVLYFLSRENQRWLIPLLPLFLFGTLTIVTTWQHRPVDVLAGIALSFGAIWLATQVRGKKARGKPDH